ncbi:MAG TPA: zinc-ribbon and DUF3426 domain-containing protein [Burkholderiales bacterium]|nr:zinc-ribbon and DUF3426 domain-containing protein [Burkholderiales bacterium]
MSLVTRCPVCATAFRIHREQLVARGGKVRCGKCTAVFDGVAGLVEEGAERVALEPSPQLGLFDPSRRPASQPPAARQNAPVPEFMARDERRRRSPWAWGLLALLAAVAFAAQGAYRFRAELAAYFPETRGALEAGCEIIGCAVRLPRRPDLMSIDSSDLQADPRREGVIVLNAMIRNRARFPQDYPALELTLTDDAQRPVVRRVLAPRDYLQGARASTLSQGIPAGGEAALRVYLESSASAATGYRLYLFYPS